MKKLCAFTKLLLFSPIFLFNSNTLFGMETSIPPTQIKQLKSLQQKDFPGAALDCGYFALYNAVQMVDRKIKTETSLQEALLKKEQFQKKCANWKAELQKGTFLSANEIDEILNKKEQPYIKYQVFVLGDPKLFEALKKADNSYDKLKELTKIDKTLNKLDLIIKLANDKGKSPFAIIYRPANMPHWITYGARAKNGSFQIFYTNSLNQPAILPADIDAEKQKVQSQKDISDQEKQQLLNAIDASAKEFEKQRKKFEESSEENAKIILKLLKDYKKQLFQITIPLSLGDILYKAIPQAEQSDISKSLAKSTLSDSWIEAEEEYNKERRKELDAEKKLQAQKEAEEREKEETKKAKEKVQQAFQKLKNPKATQEIHQQAEDELKKLTESFTKKLRKQSAGLEESNLLISQIEEHVEKQEKAVEKEKESFKEASENLQNLLPQEKKTKVEISFPTELTTKEEEIQQSKEKIEKEKKTIKQKEKDLEELEQEVKTYTATLHTIEPAPVEKEKEISEQEQKRKIEEQKKKEEEQQRQARLQEQKREAEEKRQAEQRSAEEQQLREDEELARQLQAEEEQPIEEKEIKKELPQNIKNQVIELLNTAQTQLTRKSVLSATKPFKEAVNLLEKNNFLNKEKADQLRKNFKIPLGQAQKTLSEVRDMLK